MTPTNIELLATILFSIAVLHTFFVKIFQNLSHKYPHNSMTSRLFHFLGEVEVVFGIWAGLLILFIVLLENKTFAVNYMDGRNFTEPLFVFVIMTIASTKPVISFARTLILFFAKLIPLTGARAFYFSALTIGPLLGSFITEPAAMTVTALILRDSFFEGTSSRFKYFTLGLLFVNVSIGGVLTPYAAPPVLMVSGTWGWDLTFMMNHFGWKATLAVLINTLLALTFLWNEFKSIKTAKITEKSPVWIKSVHLFFLAGVVLTAHHPSLFMGLFLFFIGFSTITKDLQEPLKLRESLLVGFFLGGLVVLGGFQQWWLEPIISNLGNLQLFLGATSLTAITDNAALTYLGSLLPNVSDEFKYLLVAGAVTGGGLTVIANAPNPAGYSILNSSFNGGIHPGKLFVAALVPTIVAALCFYFLPHL